VKELRVGIRHIEKRKLEDQAAEGRDQVRSGFISHPFFLMAKAHEQLYGCPKKGISLLLQYQPTTSD
jgi:hypothetical protein